MKELITFLEARRKTLQINYAQELYKYGRNVKASRLNGKLAEVHRMLRKLKEEKKTLEQMTQKERDSFDLCYKQKKKEVMAREKLKNDAKEDNKTNKEVRT